MTQNEPGALAPPRARLLWTPDGAPRAEIFDDIYFSPDDGLAEARAVFVRGCDLPRAWSGADRFTVGELGFGAGLNFLAVWKLWRDARPAAGELHFVSVEGFPLTRDDAARALDRLDDLGGLAPRLVAAWPPRIKGVHRVRFDEDRVVLTVAHLPARDALDALSFAADAWFLDGFAPAKNPDMWSPEVFAAVAARSKPGARLATFSVAGEVRRGLESAGFAVAKKPGHGRKRERLEAVFTGAAAAAPPTPYFPRGAVGAGPVLIVGGGIAGACAARAFVRRGVEVTVIDAADPDRASSNPGALVMPRLDLDDRPPARFHRAAYAFALAAYAELGPAAFDPCGVLQRAKETEDDRRIEALLAAEPLPKDFAAPRLLNDRMTILHDKAGIAIPDRVLAAFLDGARVVGGRVARLERADGVWRARGDDGAVLAEAPVCVAATGVALPTLVDAAWLGVRASRGQVSTAALDQAVDGYAFAAGPYSATLPDGRAIFGATYDPWTEGDALAARPEDDAKNLDALTRLDPWRVARVVRSSVRGRASLRATTPDRLPIAGPVPDADAFRVRFAGLANGRPAESGDPAPLRPGLFALGGLGSRGFTWGPLLGEAVAGDALGEPGALERGAREALHPARALVRALTRGG